MQSYTNRYKLSAEISEMATLLQRKSVQAEGMVITSDLLTPESLKPFLADCGYAFVLLVDDYQKKTAHVPLAAFAHQPTDIRSACVAVVNAAGDPASTVMQYRNLGAPVLFVCYEGQIQWWRQGIEHPQYLARIIHQPQKPTEEGALESRMM